MCQPGPSGYKKPDMCQPGPSGYKKPDLCQPGPSGYKKPDNATKDKKDHRDEAKVKRIDKKSKPKNKLTLRKILGFTDVDSKLHCLVEFKNDVIRRIPHQTVREKFPQGLIDYYEKHMTWTH
jgi:hypothetical protein